MNEMRGQPILSVRDLAVSYKSDEEDRQALRGVSFDVPAQTTVGLVGESGSGKSSVVLTLLGLLSDNGCVDSGRADLAGVGDLLRLDTRQLREIRGAVMGYVRQNPFSSLQPTLTLEKQFRNVIRAHDPRASASDVRRRAMDSMAAVGLRDPQALLAARAHELSGGMAQRIVIAMAMIHQPRLLLADEPTTGLDVSVQRRVLDAMQDLVHRTHSCVLLVTHDMGVVANYCDRVVVLYAGTVVEQGPVDVVLQTPSHPYTRALLASLPKRGASTAVSAEGRPEAGKDGCPYATRCPLQFDACSVRPALRPATADVEVACHLVSERERAVASR